MGRGDEGRGERRARERIGKGLARRDLDEAIEGLLALPPAARTDLVGSVAALFASTAVALRQTGAWGPLHKLAARAETESALLGSPGAHADELRWDFLRACLHAKDWNRAGRYLKALRPLLEERAPALVDPLTAWIDGRGEISPSVLQGLGIASLPAAPTPDPRLGYEPAGQRRATPLPTAPADAREADRQIIVLAATQPFITFAETMLEWQRRSPPELRASLARAAVPLAVRELLGALERGARPLEAALLMARLVPSGAADADLAEEILLGVRLAIPALTRAPVDRRSEAALVALGTAAARSSDAAAFVLHWLISRPPRAEGVGVSLPLLQGMLAVPEELRPETLTRLWALAVVLVALRETDGDTAGDSSWLQAATRPVLADQPTLKRFLDTAPADTAGPILAAAIEVLSVEAATGVLSAAWGGATEERRKEIASLVADLVDRAQGEALDRGPIDGIPRALLERLARSMDRDEPPPLMPEAQVVWRRLGEKAFRHSPDLLTIALLDVYDARDGRRRLEQYLEGRTDIEGRLQALRATAETERQDLAPLLRLLEEGMLRDFSEDAPSLGRALNWAYDLGAPPHLLQNLARALLGAADRHPPVDPLPKSLARSLALASHLAGSRRGGKQARKPGRGKAARKKPGRRQKETDSATGTKPAPAESRPVEQLGFAFDRRLP